MSNQLKEDGREIPPTVEQEEEEDKWEFLLSAPPRNLQVIKPSDNHVRNLDQTEIRDIYTHDEFMVHVDDVDAKYIQIDEESNTNDQIEKESGTNGKITYISQLIQEGQTTGTEGVMTCSLLKLFRSIDSPEQRRRGYVVSHTIRYATHQVAQINILSNWLISLYVMDLIRQKKPIPISLGSDNQTIWNWANQIVTTLNGAQYIKFLTLTEPNKKKEKKDIESTNELSTDIAKLMTSAKIKKSLKRQREENDKQEKAQAKLDKKAKADEVQKAKQLKKEASEKAKQEKNPKRTIKQQEIALKKEQLALKKQKELEEKQRQLQELEKANAIRKEQQDYQENLVKTVKDAENEFDYRQAICRDIKSIFDNQMKNNFPSDFKWPERGSLNLILNAESQKRATSFKNLYSTTFYNRQDKVVRNQIEHFGQISSPPVELFQQLKLEKKKHNALRNAITRCVVSKINRWEENEKFESKWNLIISGPNRIFLPQFLILIDDLVKEHQSHFGPSPLSDSRYQLSEKDCGNYASCYVHYFSYLHNQYERFATLKEQQVLSGEKVSKTKWALFPVVPQVKFQIPFIEINALAVRELVHFSNRADCQKYLHSCLDDYVRDDLNLTEVSNAVKKNSQMDWLMDCTKKKPKLIEHSFAKDNPLETFHLFFTGQFAKNLNEVFESKWYKDVFPKKTALSKYISVNFNSLISCDGVQAKLHYVPIIPKAKVSVSKGNSESNVDSISMELFNYWIEEHLTLISVDPGHKDLISAVRHHHPDEFIDYPDASLYSKRKQPLMKKLEEQHQTLYSLSNKAYYEMCGYTSASRTRQRWRKDCKLNDLDRYLADNWQTCNKRSWNVQVYESYIQTVTNYWTVLWKELCQVKYRKLRFRVFQTEQKAFAKIAKALTNGSPSRCIILWGNGSFGPSLKGHASAPNKKLRLKLSHHGVIIYLVDEYCTSKFTACCQECSQYSHQYQQPSKIIGPHPAPKKEKLRGLLYCHHPISQSPILTNPLLQHESLHHSNGQSQESVVSLSICDFLSTPSSSDLCPSTTNELKIPVKRTSRPWNRDVCSSLNIMNVAYSNAYGNLPKCFVRKSDCESLQPDITDSPNENH